MPVCVSVRAPRFVSGCNPTSRPLTQGALLALGAQPGRSCGAWLRWQIAKWPSATGDCL